MQDCWQDNEEQVRQLVEVVHDIVPTYKREAELKNEKQQQKKVSYFLWEWLGYYRWDSWGLYPCHTITHCLWLLNFKVYRQRNTRVTLIPAW